jgi:hypothetical protein
VVEQVLIFDLETWRFVGWVKRSNPLFPQAMGSVPDVVHWVLVARGWEDLVGHTAPAELVATAKKLSADTLFPLASENHEVADRHLDWVWLQERGCWINREQERCCCAACYPMRDQGDYSVDQVSHKHCTFCRCVDCRCKLSKEHQPPEPQCTTDVLLLSPVIDCGCVICAAQKAS